MKSETSHESTDRQKSEVKSPDTKETNKSPVEHTGDKKSTDSFWENNIGGNKGETPAPAPNDAPKPAETKQPFGTRENPRRIETKNQNLNGKRHEETGVLFAEQTVQLPSGEWISGVFPQFESKFSATLNPELCNKSEKQHFKECNKQLSEKIDSDPEFAKQFTQEQIDQIKDGIKTGTAPDGYVWHHEAETGKLSLVDSTIHQKTSHRGGNSIWGSDAK